MYDPWINQFSNPTNNGISSNLQRHKNSNFIRYGVNKDALFSLSFLPSNTFVTYTR